MTMVTAAVTSTTTTTTTTRYISFVSYYTAEKSSLARDELVYVQLESETLKSHCIIVHYYCFYKLSMTSNSQQRLWSQITFRTIYNNLKSVCPFQLIQNAGLEEYTIGRPNDGYGEQQDGVLVTRDFLVVHQLKIQSGIAQSWIQS